MTIYYLYTKTHKITGLKYLGYTGKADPHKYPGSGIHWVRHLKLHGYDFSTEILHECQSKTEIKERGLYYSELWDIVNVKDENGKKIWANLKPESGDGGVTPEIVDKMIRTKKANGTLNSAPLVAAKILATRRKNGIKTHQTPESIAKQLATKRRNGTLNTASPEATAKTLATKLKNNTQSNPEIVAKRMATRIRNRLSKM